MSEFPEQEPPEREDTHAEEKSVAWEESATAESNVEGMSVDAASEGATPAAEEAETAPLFQSFTELPIPPPDRIPNFGDLGILTAIGFVATLASLVVIWSAVHFHLFGVTDLTQAATEIHYALGSEVIIYLLTLLGCLLVFPLAWHKGFFAGLQWNAATAFSLRKKLFGAAVACFALALLNGMLLPGPENAPIDKIFRSPGAAWLLFAFGVTVAPFFEEIAFRGFLLPALCTAWDWSMERRLHMQPPPLGENGHPQWSQFAMVAGSILTSVPFALMHADQTGWSLGPFLLLVCVSMVLCWARLSTRSLAASVLVHASYNSLLFSLMLIGTSGFRHLDKM